MADHAGYEIDRNLRVTTVFDHLYPRTMVGTESLSELFHYEFELVSQERIDASEILGTKLNGSIDLWYEHPVGRGENWRYFDGYVTAFSHLGQRGRNYVYQATIRPWLWFLTRTADCRIFQDQSVPEIVKAIFRENDFSDFEDKLISDYKKSDYCVQYRETDFNFVSRLLENEGIYYYFKHEEEKHTLVLCDALSSHSWIEDYESIPYFPSSDREQRYRDSINEWITHHEVVTGSYSLSDYDFEGPRKPLKVISSSIKDHLHSSYEVFDYPGEYKELEQGDNFNQIRLDELQGRHENIHGTGSVRGLTLAGRFSVDFSSVNTSDDHNYIVTSVSLRVTSDGQFTNDSDDRDSAFECSFTAINGEKGEFRPPRNTPKPSVQGPQTAIVVGKSDEEVWTDKYGRVKVQFHWDRYGTRDENSSCWIRVAQIWAGKNWGAIFIPRIGQEVIVDFLEGDPDQPIITGRVYNGENMPPYGLPANATQSGLKSRSSKGGGTDHFNELRFEDKKGGEQVYFHAQRNFDRVVESNDTLRVGNNQSINIGNDQTIEVKNNRTETVTEGNETVSIEKGDRTVTIGTGNETLTIEQGDQKTTISLGKSELEAMQSIELKVGQNSIMIDQTGITLSGIQIKIDGTATTDVTAGGALTVTSGAILTMSGTLTKIN